MYSLQQKEISKQKRTNSKKVSGGNIISQQEETKISTKYQYQNNNQVDIKTSIKSPVDKNEKKIKEEEGVQSHLKKERFNR